MSSEAYHLIELEIARDPTDPRHIMPPICAGHRCILDVGCGAGQTLIASPLVPGALACGVDVDLEALRFGKRLDAHIKFVCARGEELPFGTETFDLVISRVALPCMNVPEVLSQMARVLRRGGTAWFVLHTVSFPMRELLQSIRKRRPEAVVRCLYVIANGVLLHALGVLAPFPFRRHRYGSFQTSRGIARALRCSGLELAAVQRDRFFAITARKGKG